MARFAQLLAAAMLLFMAFATMAAKQEDAPVADASIESKKIYSHKPADHHKPADYYKPEYHGEYHGENHGEYHPKEYYPEHEPYHNGAHYPKPDYHPSPDYHGPAYHAPAPVPYPEHHDYGKKECKTCPDHLTRCPASPTNPFECVNTNTNRDNCGECSFKCGANEVCVEGMCKCNVGRNIQLCNGECVDTNTDESFCGSCTTPCIGTCNSGRCSAFNCTSTCRPTPPLTLLNDKNCCNGVQCPAGKVCINGACADCIDQGSAQNIPRCTVDQQCCMGACTGTVTGTGRPDEGQKFCRMNP